VTGETPGLSGGIGSVAEPGGGSAAGGVGAGGTSAGSGAGGAGAGAGGTGGLGGIAGSQIPPILIAGGLSGIIAMGALIALNVVPVHSSGSGASPQGLVLVACPASGPVLAVVDPGQKLLVTGRSSDGAWLQVYLPGPALPYAWAPASELQPSGDTGTLPVASCEVAAASPTGTPIVAVVSPTPSPTPTPTPAPTPTPDAGPKLVDLGRTSDTIYLPKAGCTQTPGSIAISVSASDPDGVSSVDLYWRLPGHSYARRAMTHGSGSTWAVQLFARTDVKGTGTVSYYVRAADGSSGKVSRRTPSTDATFVVKDCDIPPTVTDYTTVPSQYGSYLWVPLKAVVPGFASTCPTTVGPNQLGIRGFATDPDDQVAKIVFWYTPYGGTRQSLTLPSSTNFFAYLNNKKFAKLPKPGIYQGSGYLVATDAAGRTSRRWPASGSISIEERACSPS
jgi:hypothetical protein